MPLSVIEKTLEQVCSNSSLIANEILWLTGEPLVLGLDYFRSAVDVCRRKNPAAVQLSFVVQTNGTLLDESWCDFFRLNNFVVGVSIDGPQAIHDGQRRGRNGEGSFEKAERAISLLKQEGVRGGAICVISKATLDLSPDELFHFFYERGIAWSYLIEARIGENTGSLGSISMSDLPRAEAYISRLLDLWGQYPDSYVRTFDQTARRVFGGTQPKPDPDNLGCLDILNVSYDGTFFWGNPELMSATRGPLRKVTGNILQDHVWGFKSRPEFILYQNEIHDGVARCRATCAFFEGCQGGNPAHKYYEFGSFDRTEHTSCRIDDQVVQALMLRKLGQDLQ